MKSKKRFALLASLVAAVLIIPLWGGCARASTTIARGWSGLAGADGQIIYLTTTAGTSSGFMGCSTSDSQSHLIVLSGSDGGVLDTINFQESTLFYSTPTVSNGYAYVAGYNGYIYRINLSSGGTPQGVSPNKSKAQPIIGGIAVADGRAFVGSVDGTLYALDAVTLGTLWEFETGNEIWATPAVTGGIVYVGSFDKTIYALDAATGDRLWSHDTQGAIVASPVVSGGLVYVASLDRHIYAFDAVNGSLVWQFPATDTDMPSWFWATPALVDGKLYAPNTDGRIYVIDAGSGELTVQLTTSGSIVSDPVFADGRVVVVTEEGDIYTINTASQEFESSPYQLRAAGEKANLKVRAPLAAANGTVYIQAIDPGKVFEYDPLTREAWEIGTRTSTATSPPTSAPVTVTVTETVTTTG
ncbi:MAG: PQQ-binding-like beta-propeller repeat protein [Dehalococcoidia bacterium]|nr:PQQ-binding-like beta-propeller repeat protein [Dehalococcoidia bacterium]